MSIEDKYLKEDFSHKSRYEKLMNFTNDMEDFSDKLYDLVTMQDFDKLNPSQINRELKRRKMELIRIRNKALTQQFKNIIDDYISFNVDISEGT
jgi:hypothetical protein